MTIEMAKESVGTDWQDYFSAMYRDDIAVLPVIGTVCNIGSPDNKATFTRVYRLSNGSGLGVEFEQNGVKATMTASKAKQLIKDGAISW